MTSFASPTKRTTTTANLKMVRRSESFVFHYSHSGELRRQYNPFIGLVLRNVVVENKLRGTLLGRWSHAL